MTETARDKSVVFAKVSSSDETRSTCHGAEDDEPQAERTPDAADGMAVSELTLNLLAVLRESNRRPAAVYTPAEIAAASEKALAQHAKAGRGLITVCAVLATILGFLAGGCSLYSAIKLHEAPVLLVSTPARFRPVDQAGEPSSSEFPRESPPASGAVLSSNYHPGGGGPIGTGSLPESITGQAAAPRTITLSMLNTLPFEQILETSSVILRISETEVRAYRVSTVSRNFSTKTTAIGFMTGDTLLLQSDGLAVLLAPSNSLIAGWQLTTEDGSGDFPPFPTNVTTIPNFLAKPPAGGATEPLTHEQLALWLLKKRSEENALLSSSIGQPIAAEAGVGQGSTGAPSSSVTQSQDAPFFPLTEEQYKDLDRGEPLLEGFPTLNPATPVLVGDGETEDGGETQTTTDPPKDIKFLGIVSNSKPTPPESDVKKEQETTAAAERAASLPIQSSNQAVSRDVALAGKPTPETSKSAA
ncbi:transmembrane protein [Cystoisospora suis]|uniref:Transmembrane protein n=1 Tax=Cystoisospora suis TaxID=483139 RepID=A0A2C6LB80_9APIC|nr:transmembrane protein [Cystoisospora suis]